MVQRMLELTDDEAENLDDLARQRNVPVVDLIHDAVRQLLQPRGLLATDERRRRAAAASGCIRFGDVTDLAENHDRYLAEALES